MENIISNMMKINDRFYVNKQSYTLQYATLEKVYHGYDTLNNVPTVVKCITLSKNPNSTYQQYAEIELKRFEAINEIKHENILNCYGHEEFNNVAYIFLELFKGKSLECFTQKKVSELKMMIWFRQILDAMAFANNAGLIHRDLEPANIFVNQKDQVKIICFGMSRSQDIQMSSYVGRLLYMAPQVVLGSNNYNQKCDVWSLGLILYEMLMGKALFMELYTVKQLYKRHLKFKKEQKIAYPEGLNPRWEYFTNQMIEYDKQKRPTFAQVLQQFDKCKEQMLNEIANKLGQDPKKYEHILKINTNSAQPQNL